MIASSSAHLAASPDTVLFASMKGGLGNRLRALVGYDALSRVRGCRFCMYWRPDVACEAAFTDLFEGTGFTLISEADARAASQAATTLAYTKADWFYQIWQDLAPDVPRMAFMEEVRASLDRLTPRTPISEAAASFSRARGLAGALGVHIRHTDNVDVHAAQRFTNPRLAPERVSTIDGFLQAIRAHVETMPVFLATDNPAIERQCREEFGEALITYPKSYTFEWPGASDLADGPPPGRRRTTSVADALVEMLLLGSCRRVIGTYFSSFSKFAAVWGQADYLEMAGSVAAPHNATRTVVAELQALKETAART
jgi:hypothetical protein